MSYARITGTPPEPNHIAFYYKTDDLFNNVYLRTGYRVRTMKDDKGQALVDELAISEDERDAFNLFLEQGIHDAFSVVMKMTTGVTDALILDTAVSDILGTGADADKAYGMKVKDHAAYNANNLSLVDEGIKVLVQSFIMKEWYKLTGLDTELEKWLSEYNAMKRELINKRLFQLRKPLIN